MEAVARSAPAIAIPFEVFHPAGSPSVVMIAHGLLDSAIGYVIVDNPFALKNNPHCLDFADNYHVAVDVFGVTRNISIPMRVAAICFDIVGCNV